MLEIKDLLNNFRNLLNKEEFQVDLVRDIISKELNLKIEKSSIKIKNKIIYLNIKSIYKNEILLRKEKILNELKNNIGTRSPVDIK